RPSMPQHFLTGDELTRDEQRALLERALELKADRLASRALAGRSVALVFDKPSTRTRVSFDVGVHELGGHPLILREGELQLARGESPRDTALVLSRMVHAIGIRTGAHEPVEELAMYARVPVINMLTHDHHPCQALADLLTLRERFGTLEGLKLAYVGDGNNMARSLVVAGAVAGVEVAVSSPPELSLPDVAPLAPEEAVRDAHAVYTDVWVSMGDEAVAERKRELLAPYRIDDALLDRARPDAIALHCLPAHPGDEITPEVLYGERSAIWDQAENRVHAQKALLELLVAG
ncbi:MAG TPA: ornithine carbamoyltransferase, partial [Thermoleophilaceae bacterium]